MTLKRLVDEVLPNRLGMNTSKLFLSFGNNIIYERDDELSDEEIYAKKLSKSLSALKLQTDSVLGLQALLESDLQTERNFEI